MEEVFFFFFLALMPKSIVRPLKDMKSLKESQFRRKAGEYCLKHCEVEIMVQYMWVSKRCLKMGVEVCLWGMDPCVWGPLRCEPQA